jgi:hypothetical protein
LAVAAHRTLDFQTDDFLILACLVRPAIYTPLSTLHTCSHTPISGRRRHTDCFVRQGTRCRTRKTLVFALRKQHYTLLQGWSWLLIMA